MPLLMVCIGMLASVLFATPSAATTYSVATDGSNANPCSQSAPCRTIAKGITKLTAGDTLYIRGGLYLEGIDNTFDSSIVIPSGTSWANPVTVAAYPGELVTLKPPSSSFFRVLFFNRGEQYIIIDGLKLNSVDVCCIAVQVGYPGAPVPHHIRFNHIEVYNSAGDGIAVHNGAHHVEILNSRIHHNGGAVEPNPQEHGIYLAGADNVVDGNAIYDNAGFGIHAYSSTGGVHRNLIRNNRSYGNAGDGIIVASGTRNLVYNNLVWRNRLHGIRIELGGVSHTELYHNTAYANGQQGIYVGPRAAHSVIKNNVSYGNGAGEYVDYNGGTVASHNLFGSGR